MSENTKNCSSGWPHFVAVAVLLAFASTGLIMQTGDLISADAERMQLEQRLDEAYTIINTQTDTILKLQQRGNES